MNSMQGFIMVGVYGVSMEKTCDVDNCERHRAMTKTIKTDNGFDVSVDVCPNHFDIDD